MSYVSHHEHTEPVSVERYDKADQAFTADLSYVVANAI
jgi:hypothetical protein